MPSSPEISIHEVEKQNYHIRFVITRHGEKTSADSDLSQESFDNAAEYFRQAYKGIEIDDSVDRKIVSSPKKRAIQTANAYQIGTSSSTSERMTIEQEEGIYEGDVMDFHKLLPDDQKKDWFKYWYNADERPQPDIEIGSEAIARFTQWLLDSISDAKEKGGDQEVDAFSHAPIMMGFILKLEDVTGENILKPVAEEQRFDRDRLQEGAFHFLSNIIIDSSSKNPDAISIIFGQKQLEIPIEKLKEIVNFENERG